MKSQVGRDVDAELGFARKGDFHSWKAEGDLLCQRLQGWEKRPARIMDSIRSAGSNKDFVLASVILPGPIVRQVQCGGCPVGIEGGWVLRERTDEGWPGGSWRPPAGSPSGGRSRTPLLRPAGFRFLVARRLRRETHGLGSVTKSVPGMFQLASQGPWTISSHPMILTSIFPAGIFPEGKYNRPVYTMAPLKYCRPIEPYHP